MPQKPENIAVIVGHWQKKNLSQLELTSPLQREFSFWPEKQAGMPGVLMASEAKLPALWANETASGLQ